MTEDYVEFHARSAFSFLEGASLPEALVEQAATLGMSALGILDRDGLYGAPRLYTTAKKLGMRSHVGAEVTVSDLGLQAQPAEWQPHTIPQRPVRVSLLCESQTGYRNLSQLITGYKLRQKTKGEGVATLREVKQRCEGLVCITGGDEGPLAAALERGGMDEGRRVLRSLVQTFGSRNVYVELQRHRIREQEARNDAALTLSREFHLPVLATNGVNMATAFEREVLDVLTTIRHHTSLDTAGLLLQHNANRHLRPAQEMAALFRDIPQAIAETRRLISPTTSFVLPSGQVLLGQADDLGGGVFKKRLSKNQYRSLILARGRQYWVYAYLFAKQDRANIEEDELVSFRALAALYARKTENDLAKEVQLKELVEICHEKQSQVQE